MAVVINEFEVMPAETRPPEAAPATAEPAGAKAARDPERDLEKMLRKKHARAARLMAV
jgi:hypothetical protein